MPTAGRILDANVTAAKVAIVEGSLGRGGVALGKEMNEGIVVILDSAELFIDTTIRAKEFENIWEARIARKIADE